MLGDALEDEEDADEDAKEREPLGLSGGCHPVSRLVARNA
jgi:hypothetical protein